MRLAPVSLLPVWVALAAAQTIPPSRTPLYATSSIVNAAHPQAEALAPNSIGTIYGSDLAFVTRALTGEEIIGGVLPTALIGTGVRVNIGHIAAPLYFVSPTQINFLVPAVLVPGTVDLEVVLNGRVAPAARVRIGKSAPALFRYDPDTAVATRADGSVVTPQSPAHGGDVIVLYATGLGATDPQSPPGEVVTRAARLARRGEFRVELDGELTETVEYAGVTPGFAGLYQINVRLPDPCPRNPEVRIGFPEVMSPRGVRLPVE